MEQKHAKEVQLLKDELTRQMLHCKEAEDEVKVSTEWRQKVQAALILP